LTRRERRTLRKYIGHRMAITTRDGQAVRGVLTDVLVDSLVLVDAAYLAEAPVQSGGGAVPMEGMVGVLLSNVAFFQVLSGAPG
jgi:small nuclear ribonucleoprotein (snRNP)-like protein